MPPDKFTDPVTGFVVTEPFATFYRVNGGLPIFGRPISNLLPAPGGGDYYRAGVKLYQWFERARFELHNNNAIMLGLVGSELSALKF